MPRFRGRTASACCYCRSQKVKCSGGYPCNKCQSSRKQCIFSSSDRLVSVSEAYLRQLESQAQGGQPVPPARAGDRDTQRPSTPRGNNGSRQDTPEDRLIDDTTTEYFVSKLTSVYSRRGNNIGALVSDSVVADGELFDDGTSEGTRAKHTYIPLDYDNVEQTISVKLPPHSYASYLLGLFESFIGSDYYWFRQRRFRAKMDAVYHASRLQPADRMWLACFSVVMALGESYSDDSAPAFTISSSEAIRSDPFEARNDPQTVPPGFDFFRQALLLVQFPYEEPSLEQIEALNLIAFYSYSLNRRKTAYVYAGMAIRIARLLGLSKGPPPPMEQDEQERRQRVWWTVMCLEMMTCTELSITPLEAVSGDATGLVESQRPFPGELGDFADKQYLVAQVKLCRIKYHVTKAISEYRAGASAEIYPFITPCLQELRQWRTDFQPSLAFTDDGSFADAVLANPAMRTIASLLLRYNQCFILLIRPLLLKQVYSIIHDGNSGQVSESISSLNAECLRAATDNCMIQHALSRCHRIAKFGFWESLHIFSCLTIHAMARFIEERIPGSFATMLHEGIYSSVRQLLQTMAAAGNCASQDHECLITEIEELFAAGSPYNGPTENIEDFFGWSDYNFDAIDFQLF